MMLQYTVIEDLISLDNWKDFKEEVRKNTIAKENSIKLVETTMTKTAYKNLGLNNYKIKEPDYLVIPDFVIDDHVENVRGNLHYYFHNCENSRQLSIAANYLVDWTKFNLESKDLTGNRYVFFYPRLRDSYRISTKALALFEEIKNIDSSKLIFESTILETFDVGNEVDEYTVDLINSTNNPTVILSVLSSLNLKDLERIGNKSVKGLVLYNLVSNTVAVKNLQAKVQLYERLRQ